MNKPAASPIHPLVLMQVESRLSEEQKAIQTVVREFAAKELKPNIATWYEDGQLPARDLAKALGGIGVLGMHLQNYGCAGTDAMSYGLACLELEAVDSGLRSLVSVQGSLAMFAIYKFGSEAQKQEWLPKLASAEVMAAVAVTEPDYGSDVANLTTMAVKGTNEEGVEGYIINGVKTWCTFAARANVLMLLARTDPDRSKTHRGLSLFIVPKPLGDAHGFMFKQPGGGKMEGRPIDTIGYRGMHSYEIAIENWFVPADHLIGEESGLGKGFYYQMSGFENGRLQTAARAVGVMQASYESAVEYANNRKAFGHNIAEYQLTQVKLGRMAVITQASRQFSYAVAKLMGKGQGQMEASMVKAYVCKAAEWVSREAMQIHGGFGYAEEYSVSRLFVDARVLSIFEGADETLCLKVIARRLVEESNAK